MDPIMNLILIVFGTPILIGITAWIFAFFFDSSKKLKEAKKQTKLLQLIAKKQGATDHEISECEK